MDPTKERIVHDLVEKAVTGDDMPVKLALVADREFGSDGLDHVLEQIHGVVRKTTTYRQWPTINQRVTGITSLVVKGLMALAVAISTMPSFSSATSLEQAHEFNEVELSSASHSHVTNQDWYSASYGLIDGFTDAPSLQSTRAVVNPSQPRPLIDFVPSMSPTSYTLEVFTHMNQTQQEMFLSRCTFERCRQHCNTKEQMQQVIVDELQRPSKVAAVVITTAATVQGVVTAHAATFTTAKLVAWMAPTVMTVGGALAPTPIGWTIAIATGALMTAGWLMEAAMPIQDNAIVGIHSSVMANIGRPVDASDSWFGKTVGSVRFITIPTAIVHRAYTGYHQDAIDALFSAMDHVEMIDRVARDSLLELPAPAVLEIAPPTSILLEIAPPSSDATALQVVSDPDVAASSRQQPWMPDRQTIQRSMDRAADGRQNPQTLLVRDRTFTEKAHDIAIALGTVDLEQAAMKLAMKIDEFNFMASISTAKTKEEAAAAVGTFTASSVNLTAEALLHGSPVVAMHQAIKIMERVYAFIDWFGAYIWPTVGMVSASIVLAAIKIRNASVKARKAAQSLAKGASKSDVATALLSTLPVAVKGIATVAAQAFTPQPVVVMSIPEDTDMTEKQIIDMGFSSFMESFAGTSPTQNQPEFAAFMATDLGHALEQRAFGSSSRSSSAFVQLLSLVTCMC